MDCNLCHVIPDQVLENNESDANWPAQAPHKQEIGQRIARSH
jgi:hypothetical protein